MNLDALNLYEAIINIDDSLLDETGNAIKSAKRAIISKLPWIAAVICIVAGFVLTAIHALCRESACIDLNENGDRLIVSNYSEIEYKESGVGYVLLADGSKELIGNLSAQEITNDYKEKEEVEKARVTAYLDIENADDELRDQILKAREIIIFSSSWVCDGEEAYVSRNGKLEKLPQFSELFPEWEYPVEPETMTLEDIYEMLDNQEMADSQGFVTGYPIEWDDRYVFLKVARPNRMFVEGDIVKIDYGNANSFVDFSDFRFNMDNKLYVYYNNSDVNLSEMLIVPINIEDPKLTWNYK